MTSGPRQLYLPDGENAGGARRATAQLGDLRDGAGGRVGGGTAQGGRRDAVQRASGGATARRGAAWGSVGRAWGSTGVHGRGARRARARGTACTGEGHGVHERRARRAGAGVGRGPRRHGSVVLGGVAAARACGGAGPRWRAGSLSARGNGLARRPH
jgi:hypothetical protein